jgi:hypothetical protein
VKAQGGFLRICTHSLEAFHFHSEAQYYKLAPEPAEKKTARMPAKVPHVDEFRRSIEETVPITRILMGEKMVDKLLISDQMSEAAKEKARTEAPKQTPSQISEEPDSTFRFYIPNDDELPQAKPPESAFKYNVFLQKIFLSLCRIEQ